MKQKDINHIVHTIRIAKACKEAADSMERFSLSWRNLKITEALDNL